MAPNETSVFVFHWIIMDNIRINNIPEVKIVVETRKEVCSGYLLCWGGACMGNGGDRLVASFLELFVLEERFWNEWRVSLVR